MVDLPQVFTIDRLSHLGDGIAAGPVYVPGALPGEIVEGLVADGKMSAPKIVTPSPDRIRPPCPHARTCGGCTLQHASDAFVADWKTEVVRTALAAHELETTFTGVATTPPKSRRRAMLAGRRTKKGALVGFHARASDTIVAIPGCILLHTDLMAALPVLEAITSQTASRKSTLDFTLTRSTAGLDVAVTGAPPLEAHQAMALAQTVAAAGFARLTWAGETVAQSAPPALTFGNARVTPPPGAFVQATAEGEAALLSAVIRAVGKAARIADLFAGCGTFALPLARHAAVHAVEGDAAMTEALNAGWRQAPDLHALTTETRDLFLRPLTVAELAFDAVVFDPPRAGAQAQVAELAASDVPRMAAVSCNPVTFARDAKVLVAGGYRLNWVQIVDQFRWSSHVELAAEFTKGNIAHT